MTPPSDSPSAIANPLLMPSNLPYELPPFARIEASHFGPALAEGMARQLREIAAITADPRPATFANTVEALERSGWALQRATAVFFCLTSAASTPEVRPVEAEFAPKLAAHSDAIRLDPALFGRVDEVHRQRHDLGLDAEAVRLVERLHTDFTLAGARLDDGGRDELRRLNQEIAIRSTQFEQTLIAATESSAVLVIDRAELDGMDEDAIDGAAVEARARGHETGYLLPLVLPTRQPLLAVLRNRELRRRVFRASVERASTGPHATISIATGIALLRAERAALLGFATHADAVVVDETAGTSAAVDAMLAQLVEPAVANAGIEASILAEYAERDGIELEPWDCLFYAERVRAERYSVDTAALRPYFELERVLRDGVFFAASELYGITFTPRPDLVGYHPDVRVWEVGNADGTSLGLFLGDFFAREGKRGGAWMSSFVDQSRLLHQQPVIYNVTNIARAAPGTPTLLTLDEVGTLFHEFGHALHGLFSDVTYPRFSGTSVPRDFVEYPSQVNEMWMLHPQVLASYARHVDTGAALDPQTVTAIQNAQSWGQGFRTTEYLGATLLDQAWHRLTHPATVEDPLAFESEALRAAGVAHELIPPRYRTAYFQHIFASGYSAGYYAYIWSEVLDAETVEWFIENGGLTRANGDTFRHRLLGVGGSVDALGAFRSLRGRDATIDPLLRRRGLAPVDAP
jgi:peptidyl-dipeptidase Dcp